MQTSPALGAFLLGSIGPMELFVIILIAVLIFGGKRMGEIGKGLGEGIRNFRSAVSGKEEKPGEEEKTTKPPS